MSLNSERRSERTPQTQVRDLENITLSTLQDLRNVLSISPADYKNNSVALHKLAKDIKITRDVYFNASQKRTAKLSNIGSLAEAHEYRQQRSNNLTDVFEQITDINNMLRDLEIEEISNADIRSLHPGTSEHILDYQEPNFRASTNSLFSDNDPTHRMDNAPPVMTNATPVMTNATPVMTNATPVMTNATPVMTNATPVMTNATPVMTNSTQVITNATPVITNDTPVITNDTPVMTYATPVMTNAPTGSIVGSQGNFSAVPRCPLLNSSQPTQMNQESNASSDHLAQYLLKQDLLKNTIDTFDGTAYKFNSWMNQIQARISHLNLTPQEILHVLLSHSSGEPKKMIQEILAMNVIVDEDTVTEVWSMLLERHGSSYKAADQLRTKLMSFPTIRGSRSDMGSSLQKLYDLTRVVSSYMKKCPHLEDLNNPSGQAIIRGKLPDVILERWQTTGHAYETANNRNPPFPILVDFLKLVSREYSNRNYERPTASTTDSGRRTTRVLYTKDEETTEETPTLKYSDSKKIETCSLHPAAKHSLQDCKGFSKLPFHEKSNICRKEGRCFTCLGYHLMANCTTKVSCSFCSLAHCTAMHSNSSFKHDNNNVRGKFTNKNQSTTQVLRTEIVNNNIQFKSCSKVLQVSLTMDDVPSRSLSCLAIVDEQSTSSFIDPKVVSFFGKQFPSTSYSLVTMNGFKTNMTGEIVSGLNIQGKNVNYSYKLPSVLTSSCILNSKDEIATPHIVKAHPHIASFADRFINPDPNLDVLLLIGRDCGALMNTKCFGKKPPFVHKTPLGWSLVGETSSNSQKTYNRTLKTAVTFNENDHFEAVPCFETQIRNPDIFPTFQERPDDETEGLSREDAIFLQIMKDNVSLTDEGNIVLPLPFRNNQPLPNNRLAVFNRTNNTLKNLKRNPAKLQECLKSMEKSLKEAHVEEVPPNQLETKVGCAWWLPIFAVEHKHKKKSRLVFDAAAQYKKTCLNHRLLSGPDLNNSLRSVLLRFREKPVAFIADIEGMFSVFKIPNEQSNFLRFYWYHQNDPDQNLTEYRALYHIFGACSSPAVANFALKYTTTTPIAANYPNALNFIRKNFYVDDGVHSVDTEAQGILVLSEAKKLLSQFGIRLHKIMSNSSEVTESFDPSERADGTRSLEFQSVLSTRTLGVKWNTANDFLIIEVNVPDRKFTKRGVLATVNSLYDPQGMVCPISLDGKLIMRKLITPTESDDANYLKELGWDDPLPDKYLEEWVQWKSSLTSLRDISLQRCFILPNIKVSFQELHVYSDASSTAIGFVAYLRTTYDDGNISVAFVMGNSKLAPKKLVSIPRLELCTALEASEAANWICNELQNPLAKVYFYTDSLVTLGYINNETRRFSKYVSRRVNIIRQYTECAQWNYIPTASNPADIASRPQTCQSLKESQWFTGPPELKNGLFYPNPSSHLNLPEEMEDMTSCKTTIRAVSFDTPVNRALNRSSSWIRLLRVIQIMCNQLHVLDKTRQKMGKLLAPRNPMVTKENCILICITAAQSNFAEEIRIIRKNQELPDSNEISELSPFVDSNGILRVGGRIGRSKLPFSAKHPILLPERNPLSQLIIQHYHEKVEHQGRLLTHGAIRQAGFHILNGRRLIRTFLKNCVLCQKLRGPTMNQRMADLPQDRMEQVPPFTHTGIDVFGPFYIHDGISTRRNSSTKKVWIVIFCCLVSRAVHCELVNGLDTSTFINSLRRFVALRGTCKTLRSDNGTNFVCARKQFEKIDLSLVKRNLQVAGCQWILNPPGASHFGGCYERKIGSIRRVLEKSLFLSGPRGLSRDEFLTFLCEACSIVNQTPLYKVSDHPDDPSPITPQMLLTLKEDVCDTDLEDYSQKDLVSYGKSRWRRVQYLANQFWIRWKEDYLYELKRRHKWQKKRPCF